jgi:hypothetical protein
MFGSLPPDRYYKNLFVCVELTSNKQGNDTLVYHFVELVDRNCIMTVIDHWCGITYDNTARRHMFHGSAPTLYSTKVFARSSLL